MPTLLIVVVGILVAADAPDEAVTKEQKKIRGSWSVEAEESGGKRLDQDNIKKHEWRFEGDKITIKDGAKSREHRIKIDPAQTPKTIDITDDKGDEVGHGIYKLDGDRLTIAIAKPSAERPREFATKTQSRHVLVVLKRRRP